MRLGLDFIADFLIKLDLSQLVPTVKLYLEVLPDQKSDVVAVFWQKLDCHKLARLLHLAMIKIIPNRILLRVKPGHLKNVVVSVFGAEHTDSVGLAESLYINEKHVRDLFPH